MKRRLLFANSPLHRRLPLMMLLACCLAVVMSSTLYLTYDIISFHRYTNEHLNGVARIVGINATAALMFKDQETATKLLSSLRNEKNIQGAGIYDSNGTLFASFTEGERNHESLPDYHAGLPSDLVSGMKIIDYPIVLDRETLGHLRICADTVVFRAHVYRYASFVLLVVLAVCILAFYYSRRMLRQVVEPLALLTDAATRITRDGDYSVRVNTPAPGEMECLIAAFNTMLDVIDANEKRLIANQKRLRALNRSLYMTEEAERLALASSLHDTVCQTLFGMQMTLGTLLAKQGDKRGFEERIQVLKDLVNSAIREARMVTSRLVPRGIQDLGLVSVLEEVAEDLMKDNDIVVELRDETVGKELSEERRILAFRCVQELLRNVRKHANASNVIVALTPIDGMLSVTVSDDGRGFDPDIVMDSEHTDSRFGLFSVTERIRSEGGDVTVCSAPGEGTEITLTLPFGSEESSEQ